VSVEHGSLQRSGVSDAKPLVASRQRKFACRPREKPCYRSGVVGEASRQRQGRRGSIVGSRLPCFVGRDALMSRAWKLVDVGTSVVGAVNPSARPLKGVAHLRTFLARPQPFRASILLAGGCYASQVT
jgi:hypothetical protein